MVYLRLVLVMLFWGGTFIATRIAAQWVGPFTGAAGRFLIASVCLLAVIPLFEGRYPRLNKRELLLVMGMALTGIIGYNVCFFLGLHEIQASRASLIIALNPVGIMLFSALLGQERYSWLAYLGMGLSFAGALLVITRGDLLHIGLHSSRGDLWISGCVVLWIAYTLIGRQALVTLSPLVSTAYACTLGFVGLLLAALCWEAVSFTALPWEVPAALLYLGFFGTALGFIWYYDALRTIGPGASAIFINMVPVFAVLLGVVFLKEQLSWPLLLGGGLVLSGVLLTNYARHRPSCLCR